MHKYLRRKANLGRTGLRSPELLTGSCLVVGLSKGLVRGGELCRYWCISVTNSAYGHFYLFEGPSLKEG